jgi:predicted DNA-binding transcriptional regulator AlpA
MSDASEGVGPKLLLTRSDLKALGIPGTNTTLLRREADGRFPRRIRIAGTTVCWLASEVDVWLAERAAERDEHVYADY